MLPMPLPWLRAHWRPASIAAGLLVAFCAGWTAHRPSPVIDLKQHEQSAKHAEQHQSAAQQVDQHQVAAAKVEQKEHRERHRRIHRVETIAPSGARSIVTDVSDDDTEDLQLAARVDVTLDLSSRLLLSMDSRVVQVATQDTDFHQEPAPAEDRWRFVGGVGLQVPSPAAYAHVGAGLRLATIPLVKVQAWWTADVRYDVMPKPGFEFRTEINLEKHFP